MRLEINFNVLGLNFKLFVSFCYRNFNIILRLITDSVVEFWHILYLVLVWYLHKSDRFILLPSLAA